MWVETPNGVATDAGQSVIVINVTMPIDGWFGLGNTGGEGVTMGESELLFFLAPRDSTKWKVVSTTGSSVIEPLLPMESPSYTTKIYGSNNNSLVHFETRRLMQRNLSLPAEKTYPYTKRIINLWAYFQANGAWDYTTGSNPNRHLDKGQFGIFIDQNN